MRRSAGNQPVSKPNGDAGHDDGEPRPEDPAARPSRAQVPGARQRQRHPLHVARPPVHEPVHVRAAHHVAQADPAQEAVSRRVGRQARRPEQHRQQAGAEHRGAAADRPRQPRELAGVVPHEQGPGRHQREDRRARHEELRVREPAGAQQQHGRDRRAPPPGRDRRARPEEAHGEDQVRQVPGDQVHGEQARERTGQHPRRPAGALARARERAGGEAHRDAERDLEAGRQRRPATDAGSRRRSASAPACRDACRSPTVRRWPAARIHHRYTGASGPTGNVRPWETNSHRSETRTNAATPASAARSEREVRSVTTTPWPRTCRSRRPTRHRPRPGCRRASRTRSCRRSSSRWPP